jgi:hypothetical protein
MATILVGLEPLMATNEIKIIPEGFIQASIKNRGSADGTITQNGKSWLLAPGDVLNFDTPPNTKAYYAVTMDATGTVLLAVYK